MSLSLKPKVVAIATSALIAILAATTACNSDNQPVNAQQPVVVTPQKPAPTPEIEQAVLKWDGSSPKLKYSKGDLSWEANVAEGIEEAVLKMTGGTAFWTPKDFFIQGAFVEKKYNHVIAWGKIHNEGYGKVSFTNIKNGSEDGAYWSNKLRLNDLLVVYDVPTGVGLKDYLVIAGDTGKDSVIRAAEKETRLVTKELPAIEIRELTSRGSVPVSYNPVTYVNGTATALLDKYGKVVTPALNAVRDDKGNVTLEIATRTRTNPDGGMSSVKLADILKLPLEAPIFGR